ncbi:acyl-CoA desaturase [Putridiphycobacter roseus]|uniref:Acyl-CoA desaturase n=1 Tax=Putridiphycobacter roseus TaxID=2219161 RepID=A0A2W1NRD4_9FLAO|nr:acyl-CoA desaturase [Putridiphycobacter roseus]PZE17218.1 acyl-CoA desaturase [Putridiphycobacter roseus]
MSATPKQFKYLRYSNTIGKDFESTLKKRVRSYFKENNKSKYANTNMKLKTVFMLLLYFTPYLMVMTHVITTPWLIALAWGITGLGMAGIGMCIIHDANHSAYSKNTTVNYLLGRVVNMVGAYAPTWKIQHNVLHHTYTNIQNFDEDVSPAVSVLRFTPNDTYRPIHRFQFIYAWFFYSLMTVMWITTKDVAQLFRYKKMGLTKDQNFKHLFMELLISKAVYYTYMVILPILFLDIPWWSVILLLILKHLIAGFTLAVIFILAHVVPDTAFPAPNKDLKIENNWAIHQLETTSNFAPKSRLFSWFIGGLNYQIEHHLFPNICHVHYKSLSVIVKQTAKEFGLPYYCEDTFFTAIRSHKRMLQKLGAPSVENLAMAAR